MSNDVDWTDILHQIEEKTSPEKMPKWKAIEALESLQEELQCRIDCIHDELKSEGNPQ